VPAALSSIGVCDMRRDSRLKWPQGNEGVFMVAVNSPELKLDRPGAPLWANVQPAGPFCPFARSDLKRSEI
jgi:hypothetical protein